MKPNRKYTLRELKKKQGKLLGGIIDEATFLKRQSKGVYPAEMTYRQFVWQTGMEDRNVQQQKESLAESNHQHAAYLEAHPEEQDVVCNLDENLQPNKSRVPQWVCEQRHQEYNRKKWDENPFGKIMNGINAVADVAMKLPIAPKPLKTALQVLGPVNQGRDAKVSMRGEGLNDYLTRKLDCIYE